MAKAFPLQGNGKGLLYNMNGRLYDPLAGRFLSADPYVQDGGLTQSYNRYSYCLNNPLRYTDYSGYTWGIFKPFVKFGKWVWNDALPAIDPDKAWTNFWQWVNDETPKTRQKMTDAGIPPFGVSVNVNGAGNVNVNGNINGHEVFNTANIDRSNAVEIVMPARQDYQWDGSYFQGTEQEAEKMLLSSSKMFNVETSYWSTTKGYYFEPIQGNAYAYSFDEISKTISNYNIDVGYKTNSIRETYRYTFVENLGESLYLGSNIFQRARVYYSAHTHPRNSVPGSADLSFSYFFGIRCRVLGWNGTYYDYGGYGYWK